MLTPFAAFKPTRPATPVSLLPPFLISSVSFFFLSPAVVFAAASPNVPRERAENALSLTLPASSRRGGWRGPTLRAPSKPPDLVLSLRGSRRCLSYNLSRRASRPLGVDFPLCFFPFQEMPSQQIRGRKGKETMVRGDPEDAATPSTSLGSGDSLLRQVDEYSDISASSSQGDKLVLLDDEGAAPAVDPQERLGYGAASTDTLSGLVTDLEPSRIRPHVARKAFMDAEIDANHFYLILPTPHDRAHNPPRGHITVYTRALTFGLTLPFHPFVKALCGLHRISPAQLSPNCWVTINSMIILWRKFLSLDLSVEEFLYCYSLRASPRQKGFFYIASHAQSKPPVPPVVIGKTSSAHGWKPQYFFVGGDFNSHPLDAGRRVGTQTVFNKYCRFSFSFSFKISARKSIHPCPVCACR